MAISQSYLIGEREPGDVVIPVRMVIDKDGCVVVRCVGMKSDASGCHETWHMGSMYKVPDHIPTSDILVHMELEHSRHE